MSKQTRLDQILGEHADACLDEILQRSDPAHDSHQLTILLRRSIIRKYLDIAHPSLPMIVDLIEKGDVDSRSVENLYRAVIDILYEDMTPTLKEKKKERS